MIDQVRLLMRCKCASHGTVRSRCGGIASAGALLIALAASPVTAFANSITIKADEFSVSGDHAQYGAFDMRSSAFDDFALTKNKFNGDVSGRFHPEKSGTGLNWISHEHRYTTSFERTDADARDLRAATDLPREGAGISSNLFEAARNGHSDSERADENHRDGRSEDSRHNERFDKDDFHVSNVTAVPLPTSWLLLLSGGFLGLLGTRAKRAIYQP
jgi:hypothetical protein